MNTDQKPIQLGDKKVLLVKVPVGTTEIRALTRAGEKDFWKLPDDENTDLYANGILNTPIVSLYPRAKWQILGTGTADKITSEEAKQVVEYNRYYDGDPPGMGLVYYYRDYPNELRDSCLFNAKESLLSLLASHNLKPEETVILVKQ